MAQRTRPVGRGRVTERKAQPASDVLAPGAAQALLNVMDELDKLELPARQQNLIAVNNIRLGTLNALFELAPELAQHRAAACGIQLGAPPVQAPPPAAGETDKSGDEQ